MDRTVKPSWKAAHHHQAGDLNIGMPTPISLTDCPSLIDLMLTADELGPSFTVRGVPCSVGNIGDHACLEAVTEDFGLRVIFPGWYAGEHGRPAYIIIVGEPHLCLQWLPMDPADKNTLIQRLSLNATDRMLATLAV
ncbi:hypothetical protein [Sphingomonas sp. DBB INV C78]|uniref:hypothetical protein n=1 Tax=Sphingomonas sp. DBB INV C78 TaxID=3349434 RepID=UPI0036D4226A